MNFRLAKGTLIDDGYNSGDSSSEQKMATTMIVIAMILR